MVINRGRGIEGIEGNGWGIEGRQAIVEWFKAWVSVFKKGGSKCLIFGLSYSSSSFIFQYVSNLGSWCPNKHLLTMMIKLMDMDSTIDPHDMLCKEKCSWL